MRTESDRVFYLHMKRQVQTQFYMFMVLIARLRFCDSGVVDDVRYRGLNLLTYDLGAEF